MKIKSLMEQTGVVYQQQDDGESFWYEVIKHRYKGIDDKPELNKADIAQVSDALLGTEQILVLDIYGDLLAKNF